MFMNKCWLVNVYLVVIYESDIIMRDRIVGNIVIDFEMKNRFLKKFYFLMVVFVFDKNEIKKFVI